MQRQIESISPQPNAEEHIPELLDTEIEPISDEEQAHADWQELLNEAKRYSDVAEVVHEAQVESAQAELLVAKKTGKAFRAVANTLTLGKNLLIDTPAEVYKYIREETEDYSHDLADAVLGTRGTDWLKRGWRNMFGAQNAEQRRGVHLNEQTGELEDDDRSHGSDLLQAFTAKVTTFQEIWQSVHTIPGDIARSLDTWSPEALQEQHELARAIEEKAWIDRNIALIALEGEEKRIYTDLSEEDRTEALQRIQDKKDVADADYRDALEKTNEIAPTLVGTTVKSTAWWATRGVSRVLLTLPSVAGDALSLDGLFTEMGMNLTRGLRQERRNTKKMQGTPYAQDVSMTWGPQERALGTMERLGTWIAGKGELLGELREEFLHVLKAETRTTTKKEMNVYQDVLARRIDTLTEQATLSQKDRREVAYLSAKLTQARQKLLGAEEIVSLIQRAETFEKQTEVKEDSKVLLTQYLAGRAITILRNLSGINTQEKKMMISALQQEPGEKNLRKAEAFIYASLDRELQPAAEPLITEDERMKLEEAHAVLKDSIARMTRMHQENLATLTKDITRGLQTVDREMKKTILDAEQAHTKPQELAA